MNILVVQGPNLNLLGEADGDPLDYATLIRRLETFANERGAGLRVVQSNHEGALIDALQAERGWADAILVDPAALAHSCDALRECLRILDKPAVEVHLGDLRALEARRRKSVLEDVCRAQVMGRGLDSYLDGLERLITGRFDDQGRKRATRESRRPAPAGSSELPHPTNRAAAKASERPEPRRTPRRPAPAQDEPVKIAKTLGRRPAPAGAPPLSKTIGGRAAGGSSSNVNRPTPEAAGASSPRSKSLGRSADEIPGLSRAAVRERIASRLAGRLTPTALAAWAREQWLAMERGEPVESGQRELLSDALQALALSATPPALISDHELIDLMTRLQ